MEISHLDDRPPRPGPADWFTGVVWMTEISPARDPGQVQMLSVRFDPGAHTAWHSHPAGQVLHVIAGTGLVQSAGAPAQQIRAGDTVWTPAGERHWHGAGPDHDLTHLALQREGTQWFEHLTEAEYSAAAAAAKPSP